MTLSQAAGIVRRRKEQTVELYDLFGNIYFSSFQDVVEFMCGSSPMIILTVFAVNCLFSIFKDIMSMGGKR